MSSQCLAEFESLFQDKDLVFVDFWAQWCAPCREFSIVYEKIAQQFPDIHFLKVNIEQQKELVDFLGIRSIPHLMVIKEGIVVYSDAGVISESTLKALAQQAKDFDVEEIKN